MVASAARRLCRSWVCITLVWLVAVSALLSLAAPLHAQGAEPVFGLRGVLQPVAGQAYGHVLVDPAGTRYAIAGATPEVEAEIAALATSGAPVKVWGALQRQSPLTELPLIVTNSVVQDSSPVLTTPSAAATPRPTATPIPPQVTRPTALPLPTSPPVLVTAPGATVSVYAAYLRAGPGSEYATVGQVAQGTTCAVAARAVSGGWLRLACPGQTGWMKEGLYTVTGSLAAVPLETAPTPTPLPSPTPAPGAGAWRALGYANRDLSGPAAAIFEAPAIDFDWGTNSPHPLLPPDNFSMRFDRTLRFSPGSYQFALSYDDGVRLYVDGQLVLADWNEGAVRTRAWQGTLAGDVGLRVDYFDAYGPAVVRLLITPLQVVSPPATVPPPIVPGQAPLEAWTATYFNNATLSEPSAFSRIEPRGGAYPLNYEFSLASPVPGIINEDNWSARWRGRFVFGSADYRFLARGNDGVRVYIDGIRLIDAWPSTADTATNTFRQVGGGEHEITVEMFDAGGLAWVRAWWERLAMSDAIREP